MTDGCLNEQKHYCTFLARPAPRPRSWPRPLPLPLPLPRPPPPPRGFGFGLGTPNGQWMGESQCLQPCRRQKEIAPWRSMYSDTALCRSVLPSRVLASCGLPFAGPCRTRCARLVPYMSDEFRSAPCSCNSFTASRWPCHAALNAGVRPVADLASMAAPALRSTRRCSTLPELAATCSAVLHTAHRATLTTVEVPRKCRQKHGALTIPRDSLPRCLLAGGRRLRARRAAPRLPAPHTAKLAGPGR